MLVVWNFNCTTWLTRFFHSAFSMIKTYTFNGSLETWILKLILSVKSGIAMMGNLPFSVLIPWNDCGILIHWIVLPLITMLKPHVFSRFWNPGAAGVDAFFQSWEGENCPVVPPVSIITRVLNYISLQNVAITLVISAWPSASFWPLLWQRYSILIKRYCYFKGNYACCHGRGRRSLIGSSNWNRSIIAVRLASVKS